MKRRGFLATLAAFTAASAFNLFGEPETVAELPRLKAAINPAYLNATYEEIYIWRPKVPQDVKDAYSKTPPWRYELVDGKYESVPYYAMVPDDAEFVGTGE